MGVFHGQNYASLSSEITEDLYQVLTQESTVQTKTEGDYHRGAFVAAQ